MISLLWFDLFFFVCWFVEKDTTTKLILKATLSKRYITMDHQETLLVIDCHSRVVVVHYLMKSLLFVVTHMSGVTVKYAFYLFLR